MVVAELARKRVAEGAHLAGRAIDRHALLQARERGQEMTAPCRGIQLALERHVDVGVALHERRRHDADDLVRLAVEDQPAAQDRRVAVELLLPERVREDDDFRAARRVLRVRVPAAELRRHAEHVVQRRGGREAGYRLRRPQAGHDERSAGESADGGEYLVARLPVPILWIRGRAGVARRLRIVNGHQFVRIGKRQGGQQHAVENAEHGRRDADPEGEGHDREDRDRSAPDGDARRVPHVLTE